MTIFGKWKNVKWQNKFKIKTKLLQDFWMLLYLVVEWMFELLNLSVFFFRIYMKYLILLPNSKNWKSPSYQNKNHIYIKSRINENSICWVMLHPFWHPLCCFSFLLLFLNYTHIFSLNINTKKKEVLSINWQHSIVSIKN